MKPRPDRDPAGNAPALASRAERAARWLGVVVQAAVLAGLLGLGFLALFNLTGGEVLFRYQGF